MNLKAILEKVEEKFSPSSFVGSAARYVLHGRVPEGKEPQTRTKTLLGEVGWFDKREV